MNSYNNFEEYQSGMEMALVKGVNDIRSNVDMKTLSVFVLL